MIVIVPKVRDDMGPELEAITRDLQALEVAVKRQRARARLRRNLAIGAAAMLVLVAWHLVGFLYGRAAFYGAGLAVSGAAAFTALLLSLDRRTS